MAAPLSQDAGVADHNGQATQSGTRFLNGGTGGDGVAQVGVHLHGAAAIDWGRAGPDGSAAGFPAAMYEKLRRRS